MDLLWGEFFEATVRSAFAQGSSPGRLSWKGRSRCLQRRQVKQPKRDAANTERDRETVVSRRSSAARTDERAVQDDREVTGRWLENGRKTDEFI